MCLEFVRSGIMKIFCYFLRFTFDISNCIIDAIKKFTNLLKSQFKASEFVLYSLKCTINSTSISNISRAHCIFLYKYFSRKRITHAISIIPLCYVVNLDLHKVLDRITQKIYTAAALFIHIRTTIYILLYMTTNSVLL